MPIELAYRKATPHDLRAFTAAGTAPLPQLYELWPHCYAKLKADSPKESIVVQLRNNSILIIAHCAATQRTLVGAPAIQAEREDLEAFGNEFAWLSEGQKTTLDILVLHPPADEHAEELASVYGMDWTQDVFQSLAHPLGLEVSCRTRTAYGDPDFHLYVAIVKRGTAKTTIVDVGKGKKFASDVVASSTERRLSMPWALFVNLNNYVIRHFDQAVPQLLEQYDGDKGVARLPVLCASARMMLINCRVGMPVEEFLERNKPGCFSEKVKLGMTMIVSAVLRLPKFCIVCGEMEWGNGLARLRRIRRCTGCNAEEYCGEEHQKMDWKDHKWL